MAWFSVELQPHLGRFVRLSVHSASLSQIDFFAHKSSLTCLSTLPLKPAKITSAKFDHASRITRPKMAEKLIGIRHKPASVFVHRMTNFFPVTMDHIFSLRNVICFQGHWVNKKLWITTCENLTEKGVMIWWHFAETCWTRYMIIFLTLATCHYLGSFNLARF